MARYRFYATPGPHVICISSYAGHKVRGVAICSENDEYDFEKGKALAQARVDLEIAKRRVKRAEGRYDEAAEDFVRARDHLAEVLNYADESRTALEQAEENLTNLLNAM